MASGPPGRYVLLGRVVAMAEGSTPLDNGALYIASGKIVAVQKKNAPAPTGFGSAPRLETHGTIFPGLIELHNHLAYNILPQWAVPKTYGDRSQWQNVADYHRLVTTPMGTLGKKPELLPAICRYVECKALFGGATTSQGIRLVSAAGIGRYFRGLVRNVEAPVDAAFPAASSLIADPDAKDPRAFWKTLQAKAKKGGAYLLHLSEGLDEAARKHFLALHLADGTWAINSALAGIHSAALHASDFKTMKSRGGSMVWSPLSNMLLYGDTADMAAAKASGIRIGLGPDWSPSGSKNLLGELKVAHLYSQAHENLFSPEELGVMATRTAAQILGWDKVVGTLEAGKYADFVVAAISSADPWPGLIQMKELDVQLVGIGGVPRFGHPDLMSALSADGEHVTVGGKWRVLYATDTDPEVPTLSFAQASAMLAQSLKSLPGLVNGTDAPLARALARFRPTGPQWTLALDELGLTE
ncbi:MAG TPA: amidohydrolase family protein, partial [Anaeromyxobacteraceae bacterium]|nr:amidohydrolase family protein [Anaeromyxobacteraceae bacterium]